MAVPEELDRFQTSLRLAPGQTLEAFFADFDTYMAPPLPDGVDVWRDVTIREREAWHLRCHVVRPSGSSPSDVLVYFHGGAFVVGNADTHLELAARLALTGFTVAVVDYRRAPRDPFPAAHEDAQEAVRWAREQIDDPASPLFTPGSSRLFVGGDSAGANLALATAVAAEQPVSISGCLLFYGVYDYFRARPLLDGLVVDEQGVPRRYVVGDDTSRSDPRLVPESRASSAPPCLVVNATLDPLASESENLLAALANAGVNYDAFQPAVGHGFLQNPGEPERDEALARVRRFREDVSGRDC